MLTKLARKTGFALGYIESRIKSAPLPDVKTLREEFAAGRNDGLAPTPDLELEDTCQLMPCGGCASDHPNCADHSLLYG